MTEIEARGLVGDIVGAHAVDRLQRFAAMVAAENDRQNLIARSTVTTIWNRHLLDSVQLLRWAARDDGPWLDIGTGGGFPGLVVALCSTRPMTLCEPRRRRADFLYDVVRTFELGHVEVVKRPVARISGAFATISARAVAHIDKLFADAAGCSTPMTRWLLPRGLKATEDVAIVRRSWHGVFHVEHSLSDPNAGIVVATGISPR